MFSAVLGLTECQHIEISQPPLPAPCPNINQDP